MFVLKNTKSKKGSVEMVGSTLLGVVVGVILVFGLAYVGAQYWPLLSGGDSIDRDSIEYFNLVYRESIIAYESGESSNEIPVQFKPGLILVAYAKDTTARNCVGANPSLKSACKESACLCLCDVSNGADMCNVESAVCQGYIGLDLDYDGSCNVVEGIGNPRFVRVVYSDQGLVLSTQETLA